VQNDLVPEYCPPCFKAVGVLYSDLLMNKSDKTKISTVLCLALFAIIALILVGPISQDPDYHNFADQRTLLGIPNFWNVVSNLPFAIIGLLGISYLIRTKPYGGLPELHTGYITFFIGVLLIGFGSVYYHLAPNNQALAWDRLPMTIAFMAFFSVIAGENISRQAGKLILWPLILCGIAAVLYWNLTELRGKGDLRPYILVQFLPAILVPVILMLFRSRLTKNIYIWAILVFYAVAKIVEILDAQIFSLLGIISGHSLKHFFAATATYFFLAGLKKRSVISGDI
jgi:hypothetical protein